MRERDTILIERAADLRSRLTAAETRLWSHLKGRKLASAKFSRQIAIAGYICDFVCREHRLIVEVDGSQHLESEYDNLRDARLRANGYRILRFWNVEILESLEHVLRRIEQQLPTISPPRRGGDQGVGQADGKAPDQPSPPTTAHPLPLPVGEGRSDP